MSIFDIDAPRVAFLGSSRPTYSVYRTIYIVINVALLLSTNIIGQGLPLARALDNKRLAESDRPGESDRLIEGDPVLVGAGDIAICGSGFPEMTATLIDNIPGTVYTLGDNVYEQGKLTEFQKCYDPTWGRHMARTMPAAGNHEYETAGARGYYEYFGAAASPQEQSCRNNCKGYYSYNLGDWHIIVLNSEIARHAGSEQEQWLRADLAVNRRSCTLAYWHRPLFSSGSSHGNNPDVKPLWNALYDYGADVVLGGHDHIYERFAPQNPNGQVDWQKGIRQFVVGTGGKGLHAVGSPRPNSEKRSSHAYGVLKLTLHAESYSWNFIPVEGQGFTDSGTASCVGILPTSTPTARATNSPTATPSMTATLQPSPTTPPTATPSTAPILAPTWVPTVTSTYTPGTSLNPATPTALPTLDSTKLPTATSLPTGGRLPVGTDSTHGKLLYLPIAIY